MVARTKADESTAPKVCPHARATAEARKRCVYTMRMARVDVSLPDELAEEAKAAGLNISKVTREALRAVLTATRTDRWLDDVSRLRPTGASHADVVHAAAGAKEEFEHDRA